MKRKFYLKPARRNSVFFIFIFILTILFVSCKKNQIDEDTLVRIYVENLILEESHSPNTPDFKIKKKELFKKYNTSQSEYEELMMAMKDDKDKWETFFKKANLLADDLKKSGAIN